MLKKHIHIVSMFSWIRYIFHYSAMLSIDHTELLGVIHLWRPQENKVFDPTLPRPLETVDSHVIDMRYTSLSTNN